MIKNLTNATKSPEFMTSKVVGAGVAGLVCARHLRRAGLQVEVFEAADGVGGRVRTDKIEVELPGDLVHVFMVSYWGIDGILPDLLYDICVFVNDI